MKQTNFILAALLFLFLSCETQNKPYEDRYLDELKIIYYNAVINEKFKDDNKAILNRIDSIKSQDDMKYYYKKLKYLLENNRKVTYEKLFVIKNYSSEDSTKAVLKANELKKSFVIDKDDFKPIQFYVHKNWKETAYLDRKTILCYLNSNGKMFLVSNYHSESWIFHTKVMVNIDAKVIESPNVETYNDSNKTLSTSGGIYETVTYYNCEDIIKAIAENTDKPIKIRLVGKDFYSDSVLSEKDKQAFKQSYELYIAINEYL